MSVRKILVLPIIAASAALLVAAAPKAPAPARAADTYEIDPVHSSVVFKIKHLNVAPFYGTFERMTGTVAFDDANPASCSVTAEIPVESVRTHAEKRDGHLKSKDFFNAESFPTMTFKSTSFTKKGENLFDVTGDLTIHGVTKPVTARAEKTGAGKGMGGKQIIGFDVTFSVKRSDFGITFMPEGLGDEVKVMIGVEAGK
jgi:polyisoprenoid-binding protein YceI